DHGGGVVPPVEAALEAGDLSVGEEARDGRVGKHLAHRVDLPLKLFLQDHSPAHAVEQQHTGGSSTLEVVARLGGGALRSLDHRVGLAVENTHAAALGDVGDQVQLAAVAHADGSARVVQRV